MTTDPGTATGESRTEPRATPEPLSWGQAIVRFLVISTILALVVFLVLIVYVAFFWELDVTSLLLSDRG